MSLQNFGRKIGLLIADASGEALDLSGFRVSFTVEKTGAEQPNTCKLEISNLSDTTVSKLMTGDLTRIVLQAGYEDNYAVIFDGNIMTVTHVRNGADFLTSITAGDGDKAYSYAVVSQSFASGCSKTDIAQAAIGKMAEQGTRGAETSGLDSATKYPRGRVLYASARDVAREMAKASDCQWSSQDGRVVFGKTKESLPDRMAFELSTASGMIGSPVVDKDGVTASCCLNPKLAIYDPIKIESRYVKGTYKILSVKHDGDTHSSTWMTTVKASAIDQSVQKTVKL